ncbi:unnamed protein product [Amaranthus hypochondriacus]
MAALMESKVVVKGTFKNDSATKVELIKIESYSGFFQDEGPQAILEPGQETSFKHSGIPPTGSKVGVAYRIFDGTLCVLAWEVPEPFPDMLPAIKYNKVLGKAVKAGESIDWVQIEKELDEQNVSPQSMVKTHYFEASIIPTGSQAELFMKFILPIIPVASANN